MKPSNSNKIIDPQTIANQFYNEHGLDINLNLVSVLNIGTAWGSIYVGLAYVQSEVMEEHCNDDSKYGSSLRGTTTDHFVINKKRYWCYIGYENVKYTVNSVTAGYSSVTVTHIPGRAHDYHITVYTAKIHSNLCSNEMSQWNEISLTRNHATSRMKYTSQRMMLVTPITEIDIMRTCCLMQKI